MMNQYRYEGPVKKFDSYISDRWTGSTFAVSEKKARSNLAYQFKKSMGYSQASRVTLPGKITIVKGG